MIIGVLSDTHLRSPESWLERIVSEVFSDTDMILHAGDIVSYSVLERMEQHGVLAVCGNMDDYEVAGAIPQTRTLRADGKRLILVHGWGSRVGLESRLVRRFEGDAPDVIVYGHSHTPFWGEVNGVRLFNPGSANSRGRDEGGTVGKISIENGVMEGEFIPV